MTRVNCDVVLMLILFSNRVADRNSFEARSMAMFILHLRQRRRSIRMQDVHEEETEVESSDVSYSLVSLLMLCAVASPKKLVRAVNGK
jgi:riboflavin synthase